MTVLNAIGLAVIVALLLADFLFYRLMIRALVRLIDRLPPFRLGGRYRSQSTPEKYASFRKPWNGS
ncbi:hypothetical protein [Sphingomonas sanguinis]|uniref:hypothetical protein n=1 Tax=Sphingomonas sanguinis TaxID=33051 RepID=UPI000ADCF3EF|nr:hypothetical protein [Sphingomonas sanguinis]